MSDHDDKAPEFHIYVHGLESLAGMSTGLLLRILKGQDQIMSAITDFAAKEQISLDSISATLDGIVAGVKALDTLITNLQNSPGTLSAADQAALDAIQTASQALVTKAAAISTAAPGTSPAGGGTPAP